MKRSRAINSAPEPALQQGAEGPNGSRKSHIAIAEFRARARPAPPPAEIRARHRAVPIAQSILTVSTRGRGLYDITGEVARLVTASGVTTGLCTVFVRHTSASLVIQENADPAVLRDMERFIDGVAPEKAKYEHDTEGPDDMPAHLRASITRTGESIPVSRRVLALGVWQALYLWEHRRVGQRREVVVHVAGE
jgi:secondary thiamine-phosphate synthase enzyme